MEKAPIGLNKDLTELKKRCINQNAALSRKLNDVSICFAFLMKEPFCEYQDKVITRIVTNKAGFPEVVHAYICNFCKKGNKGNEKCNP